MTVTPTTATNILRVLNKIDFGNWNDQYGLGWKLGSYECWLRIECKQPATDNRTGKPYLWRGRKWRLSQHMTEGEIVQTAFLALKTALEHEARENFRYKEATVFDPHYDIDALVNLRKQPDAIKTRDPKNGNFYPE